MLQKIEMRRYHTHTFVTMRPLVGQYHQRTFLVTKIMIQTPEKFLLQFDQENLISAILCIGLEPNVPQNLSKVWISESELMKKIAFHTLIEGRYLNMIVLFNIYEGYGREIVVSRMTLTC